MPKWPIAATVGVAAVTLAATTGGRVPQAGFAEANEFLRAGRLDEALERYRELQVEAPRSETLQYNLGWTLYELGLEERASDPESAMERFDRAADAFSRAQEYAGEADFARDAGYNAANAQAQTAKQLLAAGDYATAIDAFRESIRTYDEFLEAFPEHHAAEHNRDHMRYLLKMALNMPPEEQQQSQTSPQEADEGPDGSEDETQQPAPEEQERDPQQDADDESRAHGESGSEETEADADEEGESREPGEYETGDPEELPAEARESEADPDIQHNIEAILQHIEEMDNQEQQQMRGARPGRQAQEQWW